MEATSILSPTRPLTFPLGFDADHAEKGVLYALQLFIIQNRMVPSAIELLDFSQLDERTFRRAARRLVQKGHLRELKPV